jgi:cell division transport system permease protein
MAKARAPSSDAPEERWRPGPLLPREAAQDLLLMFVTAVLCFFACLSVIAALGSDRAARGWAGQLTGSATVLVRPSGDETPDSAAERAAEVLSNRTIVKGVGEVSVLEKEKAQALVQPWLGPGAKLADLPLPRLVSVELDPKAPASAATLEHALKAAGVDATVDDHTTWIRDIVASGRIARLAAAAAAGLIALAAGAVIAVATHAGLASRAEIVEVLHISGAEDGFIIALFQNRLAELAGVAGLIGAAAAAGAAALWRLVGGAQGLTPALPVAWGDLLAVLPCPLIAAVVAALAARVTAKRLIGGMP